MKNKVTKVEAIEEGTLAQDSLHPASHPVDDPKSRIETLKSLIGSMAEMSKDDLNKFAEVLSQFGPGKEHGVSDKSGANQSSIDMHPSHASHSTGPKTRMPMPKLGVKEDVEEMFAGQDLSEEFKEKASTIFEAAISARLMVEQARLEEEFEEKLTEAVAEINEELTSKVDTYLDYVVENWMKENAVAIESTLRNEVMEEFIDNLKNVFEQHYISVPEEKINVIESLAAKVEELETKLDEQITENKQIVSALVEAEKKEVFESYLSDLALTQQEKFKALAEGIDFDGDVEVYAKKLSIIKENYFSTEKKAPVTTNITEETFEVDEKVSTVTSYDPSVNYYAQAITKSLKK